MQNARRAYKIRLCGHLRRYKKIVKKTYIIYHNHHNYQDGGNPRMNSTSKKAILVVSFGTSYENTRKLTIEAIEHDIADAFPACPTYRAWTSKMIIAKLKKRDGLTIHTVKEALEQMLLDGITDVIVQPTHVINGIENDQMKADALSFRDRFSSIVFGNPLLTTEEDNQAIVRVVADEFRDMDPDTALVLMGHGTEHYANTVYAALDYRFKDTGHKNIFLGTVEAYPALDSLLRAADSFHPKKIVLAPFMIVAGDHAQNDLAGADPDSWMNRLSSEGYEVTPVLKGLGEYPQVRQILVEHVQQAMNVSV